MPHSRTRLADAALVAWHAAAPRLARDPDRAAHDILSARRETGGGRIAMLITPGDGTDSLILKLRLGRTPDWLEQAARAYRGAATGLADQPGLAVPRLLMTLPTHHALILSYSPGTDARNILADSTDPADHEPVMRAAGRWLGALHRGQPAASVAYDPSPALRGLTRRAGPSVATDQTAVTRLIASARTLAAGLSDRLWPQAVIHGDMTLANLLIARDQITGIDLENDSPGPVARDLAMLLIDYELWFGHHPAALRAFWQAYGTDLRDDPLLRFHIRLRLVRLWSARPDGLAQASPRRAHLRAGLQAMTARLADEEGV